MNINLTNVGKRYNRDWIFRRFDYSFSQNNSYAITGANGSGKSTLLQVIGGMLLHTEGKIEYREAGSQSAKEIAAEKTYSQIAIAAPYLDLIEEMSATEFLRFHAKFKALSHPVDEILAAVGLETAADKQIRYYSSGMKQRLKLAQAFFSKSTVLLLDEPLTNLDRQGIETYRQLISAHVTGRTVIVSSNDEQEYFFCKTLIRVEDYKG